MSVIQTMLAWLGGLGLSVAAVVAAAYALFQFFGTKWIERHFEKSLEEFRHEKMRELEDLRSQLNARLNRATILNEREFEILPALFHKLNEAHGSVVSFTSPLQSYADVDRMGRDELKDFLENSDFKSFEISDIFSSDIKAEKFRDILFWKKYNKSFGVYCEFNNYLISQSIFLDDNLRVSFEVVRDLMMAALFESQHEKQYPDPRSGRWEAAEKLRKEAGPAVDSIRSEVRTRLLELRSFQAN